MNRRVLLACGVVSSVLYVAMNVLVAHAWPDYDSVSQTVSELSAIGAPTRRLWVSLGAAYALLVTAFGCGVWRSAGANRRLRAVGGLMIAYGLGGLAWPFAPMHLRGAEMTATDTVHIAFGIATVILMLVALGVGATAFGKRFWLYSFATMAILALFGVLTALDGPRIAADLPTPWIGVWERISIGAFLIWIVVLSVVLWPERDTRTMPRSAGSRARVPQRSRA